MDRSKNQIVKRKATEDDNGFTLRLPLAKKNR